MEQRECNGIVYLLNRRRGYRNLRLHIDAKGRIMVSAPYYVSFSKVDSFVVSNSAWIAEHLYRIPEHSFKTGDSIPFLGGSLRLEVDDEAFGLDDATMPEYRVIDGKIVVYAKENDIDSARRAIKSLYMDTVAEVLSERVEYWASELGVDAPRYGVNNARTKWGVCYPSQNRLYLSYMCAVLPYELIDMTVLHEVCHLLVHGHGEPFWRLMQTHMPDLKERKARLKSLAKAGVNLNLV